MPLTWTRNRVGLSENTDVKSLSASAVILAGGHGKRFGSYKALSKVSGRTLLEHLESRLEGFYGEILIITGSETQRRQVLEHVGQMRIITDQVTEVGPLGGILTGISHTKCEYCQILPVDSPIPNLEVLQRLLTYARGFDGAVPIWKDGRMEPLHGVYRARAARKEAERLIEEGTHSALSLAQSLANIRYVDIDELQELDPDLDTFANINTRDDLEKMLGKLKR